MCAVLLLFKRYVCALLNRVKSLAIQYFNSTDHLAKYLYTRSYTQYKQYVHSLKEIIIQAADLDLQNYITELTKMYIRLHIRVLHVAMYTDILPVQ